MINKLASKNTILGLLVIILFGMSRLQQNDMFLLLAFLLIAIQVLTWETKGDKYRKAVRDILPELVQAAALLKSQTTVSPATAQRVYQLLTIAEKHFQSASGVVLPEFRELNSSLFRWRLSTKDLDSDSSITLLNMMNDLCIRLIHYT